MTIPKQVIVIRKDLKMRRGKEIAQGAHASMGAILQLMSYSSENAYFCERLSESRVFPKQDALEQWLSGSFTKICLSVNSEDELMDIYNQAEASELNACLITDNGTTEFNGVPTKTCLAIGPHWAEEIDAITSHLKLY